MKCALSPLISWASLILTAQLKAGLTEGSGVQLQATMTKIRNGASALMVRIAGSLKPHKIHVLFLNLINRFSSLLRKKNKVNIFYIK